MTQKCQESGKQCQEGLEDFKKVKKPFLVASKNFSPTAQYYSFIRYRLFCECRKQKYEK